MNAASTSTMLAEAHFSISSSRICGRWLVRVRGDIDLDSADTLEQELLKPTRGATVVVDLSDATLITAPGLRALLRQRHYGRAAIVCPPGHVRRILAIVGAEYTLAIHDHLAAAGVVAARPAA